MTAWGQRLENPVSDRLRDPATTGYVAIGLGAFAAFLAIPPIEARSPTWPIAVGIVAVALGIWTATRGRRKLGWGAVVGGLLGIGLGILATRSGTGNLETVFDATLIGQTFGLATPLVFGAIAGMFSERSGIINIALEGMMLMGAFWAVYGADKGGSWVVGLLVGMVSGGVLALVFAYFAIHLRADQIVGGIGDQLPRARHHRLLLPAVLQRPGGEADLDGTEPPHRGPRSLPRRLDRQPEHPHLGELRARDRRVRRAVQDAARAAHPRLRRAPARRGHRRDQRLL